jgi:hypothetical protein
LPAGVDVTPKGEPLSSTDDPVSVSHGPKSYGEGKAARKRVQKETSVDIKGAALAAVAGQSDGSGDNKNGSVPEGLESECQENDAGGKAGSTRSAQRRLAQVRNFVSAASQHALAAEQVVMSMRLNVAVSNQYSSICFPNVS